MEYTMRIKKSSLEKKRINFEKTPRTPWLQHRDNFIEKVLKRLHKIIKK